MTYDELEQLVKQRQCFELLLIWKLLGVPEPIHGEFVALAQVREGKLQDWIDDVYERCIQGLETETPGGRLNQWDWTELLASQNSRTRSAAIRHTGNKELWED